MSGCRILGAWILLLTLTACATRTVPSFESGAGVVVSERDERGLWYQSEKFDAEIRHAGVLYADAALATYVGGVMARLFPEFPRRMRVAVIMNHVPNAFVIPNGSVYVDAGLLAFLDNEAQLAAILAHEGSHFVQRHALEQARSVKQTLAVSRVVGLGTLMGPLVQVLAYSSIMGYSRDKEREADAEGFERLRRAGYDVRQAGLVFERLARHAQHMQYDQPVFFSSHPSMRERATSYRRMTADLPPGGAVGTDVYRVATQDLVIAYLDGAVQRGDFKAVIFLLEHEGRLDQLGTGARFYLAESYRRRAAGNDLERAEALYRELLALQPDHAPSHGALGRLLLRTGRSADAKRHLLRYLTLAPDAPDRGYVESYLARLEAAPR